MKDFNGKCDNCKPIQQLTLIGRAYWCPACLTLAIPDRQTGMDEFKFLPDVEQSKIIDAVINASC